MSEANVVRKKPTLTNDVTNSKTENGSGLNDENHVDLKSPNATYYQIFVVLLVDLLAFTCILPLMPQILDYYSKGGRDWLYDSMQNSVQNLQESIGIERNNTKFHNALFGGMLGTTFSFLQYLSAPIVGALSDMYGRKSMMIVTGTGICASYVVWATSTKFRFFFLARILGGMSKCNVAVCTAIVTDVSDNKTRGKGMALIGIAFSVGFLIGPSIGAYFASQASRHLQQQQDFFVYPAIFSMTLAAINLFVIGTSLKETLPENRRASSLSQTWRYINPISLFSYSAVEKTKPADITQLRKMGAVIFTYVFVSSGPELLLTFLTKSRWDYTGPKQGRMFVYIGILMIIFQSGYIRRLAVGSEKKAAFRGLISGVVAWIIIGLAQSQTAFYVGLFFYCFSSSSVLTCLNIMMSRYGAKEEKGIVMGIGRSLNSLGRALGPAWASICYWMLGPSIAYCLNGLLVLVPMLILLTVKKNENLKNE